MSIYDYSAAIKVDFDKPIQDPEIITGTEYYVPRPLSETFSLVPISSGDYSGYPKTNAYDLTGTLFWMSLTSTMPVWIGRDFGTPVTLTKVRVQVGPLYRPNAYILQGSVDGTTWVDVTTGNFTDSTGWKDITFASTTYRYWRVYVTSMYTVGRLYIYEMEFYNTRNTYQTAGWRVEAVEKDMVPGGVSINKSYSVYKITRSEDHMSAIVWLDLYGRIKYPEDSISLEFTGSLLGENGSGIAPFTNVFTPSIIPKIFNPHDAENINLSISAGISGFDVIYRYGKGMENITTLIGTTIGVTKVGSLPL